MTREEAKELLPVIKAFAEGKSVQFNDDGNWYKTENPAFASGTMYRIKPESKYRPFESQEECWLEMLKHHPFGWIKSKITKQIYCIGVVAEEEMYCFNDFWNYQDAFEQFTFIDGTPFGI